MKFIYLECSAGISGTRLMGTLYELCTQEQKKNFLSTISSVFPQSVQITPETVTYNDAPAACLEINIPSDSIESIQWKNPVTFLTVCDYIYSLSVPFIVREQTVAVCTLLQQAISKVYNTPLEHLFHSKSEILKTVITTTCCCLLFSILQPNEIYASPVSVYFGTSFQDDNLTLFPAPEALELLSSVPVSISSSSYNLCTPDGAALLKYFVSKYESIPNAHLETCGLGIDRMQTNKVEKITCLRAVLFHKDQPEKTEAKNLTITDTIIKLQCNLDDMNPEAIGYASSLLLKEGALDVYTTPIYMKKNRPATMLTCLCKEPLAQKLSHLMLVHTTTLGIRICHCNRITLTSKKLPIQTSYGVIHFKVSSGFGIQKMKPEYEDLCYCAKQYNLPISMIEKEAYHCFYKEMESE